MAKMNKDEEGLEGMSEVKLKKIYKIYNDLNQSKISLKKAMDELSKLKRQGSARG
jgi:hypothetical protein